MVGQTSLLQEIDRQIEDNTFPRFSIFVGARGSEKQELSKCAADRLKANYVPISDCSISSIRDVCESAYKVSSLTVYNILDADSMSTQAKNVLLKVTEEPPNRAFFTMTLEDINNTLPTIKSRGSVYFLQPYNSMELESYCMKYSYTKSELELVLKLCETPGDIDLLNSYGPQKFYDFICKVVENVAIVNGSNVFKIAQSVKFKDTDEAGYDLILFWKVFCVVCLERGYYKGLKLTSGYMSKAKIKSINRAMLFDKWIFDIRQEWRDAAV